MAAMVLRSRQRLGGREEADPQDQAAWLPGVQPSLVQARQRAGECWGTGWVGGRGPGGQAPASQVWQNLKVPTLSDPQRGPRAFMGNVVPVSVQSWTREPGWGLSPAGLCTLQAGPVFLCLWMHLGAWDPSTVPFLSPR